MFSFINLSTQVLVGITSFGLQWEPGDNGQGPYQVCIYERPSGRVTCHETERTSTRVTVGPEWRCLQITVEDMKSSAPPEPLFLVVNPDPSDVDRDCAVGLPDFLEVQRSIGKTAPGQPGRPIIVEGE